MEYIANKVVMYLKQRDEDWNEKDNEIYYLREDIDELKADIYNIVKSNDLRKCVNNGTHKKILNCAKYGTCDVYCDNCGGFLCNWCYNRRDGRGLCHDCGFYHDEDKW